MSNIFTNRGNGNIFANRDALSDEYVPTEIVGREAEKDAYADALLPVYQGETPNSVFLYGLNGVGKTVVTHWILDQLTSAEGLTTTVTPVYINCEQLNTSYQLTIAVTNSLVDTPNERLPKTGLPASEVYERLFEELEQQGGTVLIVLDEIDTISEVDTFLYSMTRARSNRDLSVTKLGIIGISTDTSFTADLPADVRSTLREQVIEFPPYDSVQLCDVLKQRVETAFHPNVVTDGAIRLAAAVGANNKGDARLAIDLLRDAGDLARNKDATNVTDQHVEQAREEYRTDRPASILSDLPINIQLVMYAIVTLTLDETDEITSNAVYDRYTTLTANAHCDPVSARRAHDYYSQLDDLNLITATERSGSHGRYMVYSLAIDPETTVTALEGCIDAVGVHQTIRRFTGN
ncbi:Cdc6/Cdc18 family protein [Halocatena pleomorpha]|uniref:ORC1-type DNA replication protein n=1 Tax=Halocatena pleomorpha TaxID=1785090 RepID=A0A3P3R4R7_9EURY|nr:orc1/cdc6 family replication initiation protein [Halocatena pleomorpha]RRJ27583.1 AAA family ATPase [Halocatena pleomorpha]